MDLTDVWLDDADWEEVQGVCLICDEPNPATAWLVVHLLSFDTNQELLKGWLCRSCAHLPNAADVAHAVLRFHADPDLRDTQGNLVPGTYTCCRRENSTH